MLERLFNTDTFFTAQGALNGISARHSAIANNLANANTPGYKRNEVPFESALSQALKVHNIDHPAAFNPSMVKNAGGSIRADGNNVDMEQEMVRLAENSLRYETLTHYIGQYFSGLKTVINSGGK